MEAACVEGQVRRREGEGCGLQSHCLAEMRTVTSHNAQHRLIEVPGGACKEGTKMCGPRRVCKGVQVSGGEVIHLPTFTKHMHTGGKEGTDGTPPQCLPHALHITMHKCKCTQMLDTHAHNKQNNKIQVCSSSASKAAAINLMHAYKRRQKHITTET